MWKTLYQAHYYYMLYDRQSDLVTEQELPEYIRVSQPPSILTNFDDMRFRDGKYFSRSRFYRFYDIYGGGV